MSLGREVPYEAAQHVQTGEWLFLKNATTFCCGAPARAMKTLSRCEQIVLGRGRGRIEVDGVDG